MILAGPMRQLGYTDAQAFLRLYSQPPIETRHAKCLTSVTSGEANGRKKKKR